MRFTPDMAGADAMAADRSLAEAVARSGAADFRLYTWKPWCVSLGFNQREADIDAEALFTLGFDCVRRPTGGRAVLHANELTYCVAVPLSSGKGPRHIYAAIHEALLVGMAPFLSKDVEFSRVPTDLRKHYASGDAPGAACFSSSAESEIMWKGRKMVGSAQRVLGSVILQHGSILCGPGHERLADVLRVDEEARERVRCTLRDGAVTMSEAAGTHITATDIAPALETVLTDYCASA